MTRFARRKRHAALVELTLLACLLLALTIARAPIPSINLDYGDTTISLSADRAWTLLPGDCATIRWDMHGIQSLYIDGAGKIGAGEVVHCQGLRASSPQFDITAQNGVFRSLSLPIPHLPDLLFYVAGFVGLFGAALLAVYFFVVFDLNRPLPLATFAIVALLLAIVGGWLRLNTVSPPPLIDEGDNSTHVRFWAARDRTLFPHQCVDVGWSLAGAQATRLNGKTISKDPRTAKSKHCAEDGHEAVLEIRTDAGETATYQLPIPSLFPQARWQPTFAWWSAFGLALAALVCMPLLWRTLREKRRSVTRSDMLAAAGCALFVLALSLPYGLGSSAQWENWVARSYIDGGDPHQFAREFVGRFWALLPHVVAALLNTESFAGFHLLNMLSQVGKMLLLYAILRQLEVAPLYAYLAAMLFLLYPVNPMMQSLRAFHPNTILLLVLAAACLLLDFAQKPRRLTLLGIWLLLLLNLFSYEAAFVIILALALLLWRRGGIQRWRTGNLTAIWLLAPAMKLAYLVLLLANDFRFYNSSLIDGGNGQQGLAESLGAVAQALGDLYTHTFVTAWRDAFAALPQNQWWLLTLALLALVGGIAWHLARQAPPAPPPRQLIRALLLGLLLVAAATGVMIWLPYYHDDFWRMHQYVPLGASVATISAILLLTACIRRRRVRHAALIVICLALMLGAAPRLLRQSDHFALTASAKAAFLQSVLEAAPAIYPDTQLVIMTELPIERLRESHIGEFVRKEILNGALYTLYEKSRAPELAYMCFQAPYCSLFTGEPTIYSPRVSKELLRRTLVLQLKEDLSVEVMQDPVAYFGWDADMDYDAGRLYAANAPLPPRAESMLGLPPRSPRRVGGRLNARKP